MGRREGQEASSSLSEIVLCSLEPWDEVWRRNQFFADILLRRNPSLRILFVEPPADPLFDIASGRLPGRSRLRNLRADGRLRAFRPLKLLPRRLSRRSDTERARQVVHLAGAMRMRAPILWLNDVIYAPLIAATGWPTVYDVTDDWTLFPSSPAAAARIGSFDRLALAGSAEVVVCSTALAETRGKARPVSLVPNAVDADHFRHPRPRPTDLPPAPLAVYVGTLHDERLDVELLVELARSEPSLSIALVGPDSLGRGNRRLLGSLPQIHLLGARPYESVPGYLQHADVVIVPHRDTPFTQSLDPIKAYECLAIETPTVATPVAGFRELADAIAIAPREEFITTVRATLSNPGARRRRDPPGWEERVEAFEAVLLRAHHGGT